MDMRKITIALLAVGTLASAPLSANATLAQASRPAQTKTDDSTLQDRSNTKLDADASLKKFDLDVTVSNGVATLTGKVRTAAEKTRAARAATVTGITRVVNQIVLDKDAGRDLGDKIKDTSATAGNKVKSAAEIAAEKTKEGLSKAGGATKDGLSKTGEKTKEGLSKTGEVITDAWIITRVKADFVGENLLKDSNINVDVKDRAVTLKGTVKTQAGRARAVAIAKGAEGVKIVTDQLVIR